MAQMQLKSKYCLSYVTSYILWLSAIYHNTPQELYPQLIHRARGVGTFCAIDGCTIESRDKLLSELRNNGRAQQPIYLRYLVKYKI